MEAPETVTDAVRRLESRGYRDDFQLVDASVACPACGHLHRSADIVVDEVVRFYGPSDPGDEAIVVAVECAECGDKGIIVSAFGPDADRGLLDLVDALDPRSD